MPNGVNDWVTPSEADDWASPDSLPTRVAQVDTDAPPPEQIPAQTPGGTMDDQGTYWPDAAPQVDKSAPRLMQSPSLKPKDVTVRPFGPQGGTYETLPDQTALGAFGNKLAGSMVESTGSAAAGVPRALAGLSMLPEAGQRNAQTFARSQIGAMDRIDAGESVPVQDDPLGYQDIPKDQRPAFRKNY